MQYFNNIIINYPYILAIAMMIIGIYIVMIEKNLIKKVIGINLLQGGIILFFVIIGKIRNGVPPVYNTLNKKEIYSNPTPHVLMLTAIVVGLATAALACSLIYIIYKNYGTIDETKLLSINEKEDNDHIITD